MKKRVLTIWFALSSATLLMASEAPTWHADYKEALKQAKAQGKPVLLDFTAPWCMPCRLMEKTTFADEKVRARLSDLMLVKVPFDTSPLLVARYRVRAIPALILLTPAGEEVARAVGYREAGPFLEWLDANAAEAGNATPRAERVQAESRKLVAQILRQSDGAAAREAFEILFARYAEKDDPFLREAADEALGELARKEPERLTLYLNDDRLMVRIVTTNALKSVFSSLDFDPWLSDPERTVALAKARAVIE